MKNRQSSADWPRWTIASHSRSAPLGPPTGIGRVGCSPQSHPKWPGERNPRDEIQNKTGRTTDSSTGHLAMQGKRRSKNTNPPDRIPTWSSRFAAAGCVLALISGFAWTSPLARVGIDLLRPSEVSQKTDSISSAPQPRISTRRLLAADASTNPESAVSTLPRYAALRKPDRDRGSNQIRISRRRVMPDWNSVLPESRPDRSIPGIATRLLDELRHQLETGLRRLSHVAFSSTLP